MDTEQCSICEGELRVWDVPPPPLKDRACPGCFPGLFVKPNQERRAHHRVDIERWNEIRLRYCLRSLLKGHWRRDQASAVLHDLSEGGALFLGKPPRGMQLSRLRRGLVLFELEFTFPNQSYLKTLASLRWDRGGSNLTGSGSGHEFGVQFEEYDPGIHILQRFLATLSSADDPDH